MPEDTTDPGVVTPLMLYQEIRGHRKDTGKQFAAVGNRLAKVEQKVDDLAPKVEVARQKANGATEKIAGISGQWKVLLYFLGAGGLGVVGWLLKGAFG